MYQANPFEKLKAKVWLISLGLSRPQNEEIIEDKVE
jgi:hypothetical protein